VAKNKHISTLKWPGGVDYCGYWHTVGFTASYINIHQNGSENLGVPTPIIMLSTHKCNAPWKERDTPTTKASTSNSCISVQEFQS
jgi:hypothetical protein